MSNYSIKFNETRKVWIAKFRKLDGTWGTKFLPKTFLRAAALDAERWLISWLAEYQKSGVAEVLPTTVKGNTIAFLAPKWLKHRYEDQDTAPNTYNGFKSAINNWVLDNPKFTHHSIQNLDIETELTVGELRTWILSLKGMNSTKIDKINCIKSFFNDCIGMEWLNPDMANPIDKPAIKKLYKSLQKTRTEDAVIAHLSQEHVATLLTGHHQFLSDYRRLRYLIAITAGLRDHEVQGLTWSDINWTDRTINVNKQLAKIGHAPLLHYKDLQDGMTKDAIMQLPNAIAAKPKSFKSKRIVPLHPLTAAATKWWFEKGWKLYTGQAPSKDSPVFPRGKGKNAGRLDIGNPGDFCFSESASLVRSDLLRLDLPATYEGENIDFHALRHTFSHLLESIGADDAQVGVLLGHSGKSVARNNYLAKNMNLFRSLVEKLPIPNTLKLQGHAIELPSNVVPMRAVKAAASS